MTTLTDAGEARAQLQALAAEGFPVAWLADQLGMSTTGLGRIRNGQQVRTSRYAVSAIDRLHHRLHGTTPAQHRIPEGPAAFARLQAARNGWTTRKEVTT